MGQSHMFIDICRHLAGIFFELADLKGIEPFLLNAIQKVGVIFDLVHLR